MGKLVERWIADDGTEFDNKRDMLIHEMTILDQKEIDYFVNNVIKTSPKRIKEYQKLLTAWQKYIRAQQFDTPSEIASQSSIDAPLNPLE